MQRRGGGDVVHSGGPEAISLLMDQNGRANGNSLADWSAAVPTFEFALDTGSSSQKCRAVVATAMDDIA